LIIDITDQTNILTKEHIQLMKDILTYAIQQEDFKNNIELSVSIVTNEEIHQLNKQYRMIDAPTDVLSFEIESPFETIGENFHRIVTIGDIIISVEKVQEQATEYNHSFERELAFLTIHGFLHLIGYTHDTTEEETVMFNKQERILKEFQLER